MRTLFLVGAAAIALGFAYQMTRPLEGTSWEVKTKADSFFSLSHRDTLIFKDGRLTSARWADQGFAPAGYAAKREEGKSASWAASLRQDGKGTLVWHGMARGDRMEGTLQWTSEDGRTRSYKFKGVRSS